MKFDVPHAVRAAAALGLVLVKEGHGGKGLTPGALLRAGKLARGTKLDLRGGYSVERMRDWFARHASDWKPGWNSPPTPGYVAWMLWGGDEGKRYVDHLVEQYMPEKIKRLAKR